MQDNIEPAGRKLTIASLAIKLYQYKLKGDRN